MRVAQKLEKLFAGREMDVSSELAMHFEAAAEWVRAAQALCTAAGKAMRRGARDEGVKLTEHALRLLENLSEPDREAAERKIREQMAGVEVCLPITLSDRKNWTKTRRQFDT